MSEAHGTICTPGASRCDENVAPLRVYRIVGRVVFPPLDHDAVGRWRPDGRRVARAASYQVQVFPARGDSRDVSRENALPHTHCQPPRHAPSRVSICQSPGSAARARSVAAQGSRCRLRMDRHRKPSVSPMGTAPGTRTRHRGRVERKAATPSAVRTMRKSRRWRADRSDRYAHRRQSIVRRERRICVRPAEIDARATPRWTGELPDMRGPRIREPNRGLDCGPTRLYASKPFRPGNDASAAGMETPSRPPPRSPTVHTTGHSSNPVHHSGCEHLGAGRQGEHEQRKPPGDAACKELAVGIGTTVG